MIVDIIGSFCLIVFSVFSIIHLRRDISSTDAYRKKVSDFIDYIYSLDDSMKEVDIKDV